MRAVAVSGRWVWRVSGLVAVVAFGVPLGALIVTAGQDGGGPQAVYAVPIRTVEVTPQVTSLSVQSYGAPVNITAGAVRGAQINEGVMDPSFDGQPQVSATYSRGHLTLALPDCAQSDCGGGLSVTVPSGAAVTVESDGAPVSVSGVAAANVDSGGAPVRATDISGQLTVSTENGDVMVTGAGAVNVDSGGGAVTARNVSGRLTVNSAGGPLILSGISGLLDADTGGAPLVARDVAATTVSVDTGGGDARLLFAGPPQSVTVNTEGGLALLTVPGGPYALNSDDSGPQFVTVATNPAAARSITVVTGGGPLRVGP